MSDAPAGQAKPALERRLVSVLFADLVGFTPLSEQLDAEEVAALQERYFAEVRQVVGRHGGRLEKFIGDAAMAVFGVPRTHDDDAERATRAGLALLHAVEGLSASITLPDGALQLRVGINTGEVAYSAADDGEWRVSGDTVNVAARLQAAAEPGNVLIGDDTAFAVAEAIALEPPRELELKGKALTVRAWRAVSPLVRRSREQAMGNLRAPLLGRQPELGHLEDLLSRAREGSSEAIIVVAQPGTGKTRLIEEFASRTALEGEAPAVLVRRARLAPENVSPAAAVAQLLSSQPVPAGTEPREELARLLSGEEATGADAMAPTDLARARQVLFRAWIDGLDGLSSERTQIWLIEDIHWSGGDLLAFIEEASSRPVPAGRLIICTARPALLERLTERSGSPLGDLLLELPPLDGAQTEGLLEALVGNVLPAELRRAVIERADGNPLFVEELLRSWISLGTLVQDGEGTWRFTRDVDQIALPSTVQAIYASQIDDLPDTARVLVRRASVAGRRVPRRGLAALELEQPDEAVAAALRRALLREDAADLVTGPSLSFRHALLRDAGYASLSKSERARLHLRLAGWYEQAAGPRSAEIAEVVARHYAAAADHASRLDPLIADDIDHATARRLAVEWYRRAARHALAGAAHETARQLLRDALQQVDPDDHAQRGRLLLALGEATAYTADMDLGAELLQQALAAQRLATEQAQTPAARADARRGVADAAAALGRVWTQQLRFEDALSLADQTISELDHDDPGLARLLGIRAWTRATLHHDRSVIADVERGLDIARRTGDRRLELDMLHWRAGALSELELVRRDDYTAIEQLATQLGDWSRAVQAIRSSVGWLVDDEAERVWEVAERAEQICRREGLEEDLAWIEYVRSEAGFISGQWDRALEAGLHALQIAQANAYHRAAVRTWHVVLPIADARGEGSLIEQAHEWFEARRATLPDSPYARMMYWVFERRFIKAGLRPPSEPSVEALLPSFDTEPGGGASWVSAQDDVLDAWLEGGELAGVSAALERLDRGLAAAIEPSLFGRGTLTLMHARLAAAQSPTGDDADRLAREALQLLRDCSAPWWQLKALRLMDRIGTIGEAEKADMSRIDRYLSLATSAS